MSYDWSRMVLEKDRPVKKSKISLMEQDHVQQLSFYLWKDIRSSSWSYHWKVLSHHIQWILASGNHWELDILFEGCIQPWYRNFDSKYWRDVKVLCLWKTLQPRSGMGGVWKMREMVSHGLRYHVRKRCERLCVRKMRKEGCFDKKKRKSDHQR